jgi:hypothetical protein
MYKFWFQCVRGCDQRYSIYDVVYRCQQCGGLLDVEHDIKALKSRSAAAWMRLFDQRIRTQVGYRDRALKEVVARYDNPPLELPADYRTVKDAIARELDRRV